jgi:hypothetical protein
MIVIYNYLTYGFFFSGQQGDHRLITTFMEGHGGKGDGNFGRSLKMQTHEIELILIGRKKVEIRVPTLYGLRRRTCANAARRTGQGAAIVCASPAATHAAMEMMSAT